MTKPLVIYHDNCADGFGAAFAAWLKLGDEAEYLPAKYSETAIDLRIEIRDREVYVLDFSFPRDQMDALFSLAKRVVWLDHHKTAFEMWGVGMPWFKDMDFNDRHHIELDNNKSGAMLAWRYFHPGTGIPMLIRHIDDYDRWQFKMSETKAVIKGLWSYAPWSFHGWKAMVTDWRLMHGADIESEGAAILRAHDQNVQSVVKGAVRPCRILAAEHKQGGEHWEANILVDQMGLAANCPPHLTSDVGHELAVQSGTFGLCWQLAKEDKGGVQIANCSLRSNGDYDVSAVAKAFGGGGHKNAAGFEVPVTTLLGWLV